MLDALAKAHRDRWGTIEDLLALVASRVDLLWRQIVVDGGRDAPDPLEIRRPGQPDKKKKGSGLGALAQALTGHRKG